MASYSVNPAAVVHARRLIDGRRYALRSEWGERQPDAESENRYGDLRRVHRSGLIACVYRAAAWRHKEIELAAHDVLQRLDATAA